MRAARMFDENQEGEKHEVHQRIAWGNTVPVDAASGGPVSVVQTPTGGEIERDWQVTIQCKTLPTSGTVTCVVTFGQGAIVLRKTVTLSNTRIASVVVSARMIQVSAQVINGTGIAQVTASVVPAHFGSVQSQFLWSAPPPIIDADHGLLLKGGGVLGKITVNLTTVQSAGVPLYVGLFDASTGAQPANGTAPISGGWLPGVVKNIGDSLTLDLGSNPGAIGWTNGCVAALSSTGDTFTAPTAGNQATFELTSGS